MFFRRTKFKKFAEALLKFPVHIVEAYRLPCTVLNPLVCIEQTKEIIEITTLFKKFSGKKASKAKNGPGNISY